MNFVLRHSLPGYAVTGIILPAMLLLAFVSMDLYLAFLTVFALLSLAITYAEVDFAKRLNISTRSKYLVLSACTGLGAVCIALAFVGLVQLSFAKTFTTSIPWFAGAYSVLFTLLIALPVWSAICGLVYWSLAAKPKSPNVVTSDRFTPTGPGSSFDLPQAANQ